jgi:colicin import membrane protein
VGNIKLATNPKQSTGGQTNEKGTGKVAPKVEATAAAALRESTAGAARMQRERDEIAAKIAQAQALQARMQAEVNAEAARVAAATEKAKTAEADAAKAKAAADKAAAAVDAAAVKAAADAKSEAAEAEAAEAAEAEAIRSAAANAARAAAVQAQVSAAAPTAPTHELVETAGGLTLSVLLPGVISARSLVVDVDTEFVGLSTDTPPLYEMKLNLPFPINPDTASSSFKKKKSTLLLKLNRV